MTEQEKSLIGLGNKLIGSLPAQFLMLAVLNIVFFATVFWFLNARDEARERMLTPILAACLERR